MVLEDELKDLLGFLFQRADATQIFWNFYVGAVTGVLALVTAGRAEWLNPWVWRTHREPAGQMLDCQT